MQYKLHNESNQSVSIILPGLDRISVPDLGYLVIEIPDNSLTEVKINLSQFLQNSNRIFINPGQLAVKLSNEVVPYLRSKVGNDKFRIYGESAEGKDLPKPVIEEAPAPTEEKPKRKRNTKSAK